MNTNEPQLRKPISRLHMLDCISAASALLSNPCTGEAGREGALNLLNSVLEDVGLSVPVNGEFADGRKLRHFCRPQKRQKQEETE